MRALADPPAVVAAAVDDVDLLVPPVADVADEEPPRAVRLPRQPPRVAEAVGEDLRPAAASSERVVGGMAYGCLPSTSMRRILPLSLVRSWALPCGEWPVARVALAAAVARAEVQHPVRPEAEPAAAVVELRLVELEDDPLGRRVGAVGVGRVDAEFAQRVGVVLSRRRRRRAAARRSRRRSRPFVAKSGWNARPSRPRSS